MALEQAGSFQEIYEKRRFEMNYYNYNDNDKGAVKWTHEIDHCMIGDDNKPQ